MALTTGKTHKHKGLLWTAKIGLAVLLCWLVLRKIDQKELLNLATKACGSGSAWLGVAIIPLGIALGAWRWQRLLRAGRIKLTYTKALLLTVMGNFFNHALPSITGGDVIRAYYVMRAHPNRKSQTVISLLADRLAGLTGLAIVCLLAIALGWSNPLVAKIRGPIFLLAGLLALLAVVLFVPGVARTLRLTWLIKKLPLANLLDKLRHALRLYSAQPGVLVLALATSIIIHLILLTAVYLGGRVLAPGPDYQQYLVLLPPTWMISALAVTPGALGWMEWWYQMFFARVGVSQTAALSLSLFHRLAMLIWALPGLIIYIKGPGLAAAQQLSVEQVENILEGQDSNNSQDPKARP